MSLTPVKIAEEDATPPPAEFDFASPERAGLEVYRELRGASPDVVSEEERKKAKKKRRRAERRAMSGKGPAPEPEVDAEEAEARGEKIDTAEEAEARGTMETAKELFQTTHGGAFDPKSKTDLRKMGVIQKLMESGEDFGQLGGDSDEAKKNRTKFALKIYRMG